MYSHERNLDSYKRVTRFTPLQRAVWLMHRIERYEHIIAIPYDLVRKLKSCRPEEVGELCKEHMIGVPFTEFNCYIYGFESEADLDNARKVLSWNIEPSVLLHSNHKAELTELLIELNKLTEADRSLKIAKQRDKVYDLLNNIRRPKQ